MLNLYNTRTKIKEPFHPLTPGHVGLYTCGPTVYNYVHLGNLRSYTFEDILHRTLKYHGYEVTHVMNITDVGHLTDDANDGEDKMEKGSRREGKTAWDVAAFYTKKFKEDIALLNVLEPTIWCKATDHIEEQIAEVQLLIEKGHTYETSDGIYFDTTTIDDYGKLANLNNQALEAGARVDMGEKRNPHDFALWKFSAPGETRQMEWEAFGKKGFPGWHIECSAMATKYLGTQFDIHCGGVDHIPVHHTNEIAQAEAAYEQVPWVNVWMHNEFLLAGTEKMAKSNANFLRIQSLLDKGISPLAYRYYLLGAHYRKQLTFSWDALEAAATGLARLKGLVKNIPSHAASDPHIMKQFEEAISDDLNTPEALAILWTGLKEHRMSLDMVITCDKILGLDLHTIEDTPFDVPQEVASLLEERTRARSQKDWKESDRLRDEIAALGFIVQDTSDGQTLEKQ